MHDYYRSDLAHIHDTGFGQLGTSAARLIIDELRTIGAPSGLIVELGCGGGLTSRLFCDAGYEALGVDLSHSLIEIARNRVPEATFRVGTFTTVDIPPCIAVTAIGEVFNYTLDPASSPSIRREIFRRIYRALAPDGLLVFDMAGPDRAQSGGAQRTFTEGADWAVLAETEHDSARDLLIRRITTFRKLGELYRRDFEIHGLQLVDPEHITKSLHAAGFSVRVLDRYGPFVLPKGLVAFLAKKEP